MKGFSNGVMNLPSFIFIGCKFFHTIEKDSLIFVSDKLKLKSLFSTWKYFQGYFSRNL